MPFRELSDSDLNSYLEGSVWSEKPSAADIFTEKSGHVVTVFPRASHSNMIYGYPANHCETVFPAEKNVEPEVYIQQRIPAQEPFFNGQPPTYRRPPSPGPVAGAGEITNTSHGFTIQLDVFKFAPEEIKLVLTDDTLSISGERFEITGDGQTLRRSFSRKYSIPEDVHLDTIRSHLTNSGVLVINGSRKGWRETSISTQQPAPSSQRKSNGYGGPRSVISTV